MPNFFKPKINEAREELANIITCKEVYDKDSLDGVDGSLPLFYLKLRNSSGKEFDSSICLCKSELVALKTIYNVKYNSYSTKKVYSLELSTDKTIILDEIQTTLGEVREDEKLKENFKYRLSEGITPYTKKDLKKIDEKCELIWDMYDREPMCIVKREDGFILPKNALDKKAHMPFFLGGGTIEMIDKNGKYGIISTGNSLKNDLNYKLLYPFEYHYIRRDGFGNAELLKEPLEHGGDYKKLICTMVNLWDESVAPKQVLLNSTTQDEYITVDSDGLLTQHTKGGSSKPYQTIIENFLKIKPVQDANGLWGYIDKDAKEIIACKFKDWNFFNNGYAVLEEDDKPFVINEQGAVVIEPKYETIKHYKNDLFFVKLEYKWGILKGDAIYIEPSQTTPQELEDQIRDKKRELHNKMYKITLQEYMKLFDTPQNQKDLQEMGLLGKKVKVKECEIIKNYKEILKDPTSASIGFHHQMGASCYTMDIELPITFQKLDGSSVSLGVAFEYLSLEGEKNGD